MPYGLLAGRGPDLPSRLLPVAGLLRVGLRDLVCRVAYVSGPMTDRHAIIVLPQTGYADIEQSAHRRWLARGRAEFCTAPIEPLQRVLELLGRPQLDQGLAALRLWGQTGERPAAWVAAADPVCLEATLYKLRVHATAAGTLAPGELSKLFDDLQTAIGKVRGRRFLSIGSRGYLQSVDSMRTSSVSADLAAAAYDPSECMPQGEAAAVHDELIGELQLFLHTHPVNDERERAGQRPINSLWLWGEGSAPAPTRSALPALFGEDPLFRGFWLSCAAEPLDLPEDIGDCVEMAPNGFVAVCAAPADGSQRAHNDRLLQSLRAQLARRAVGRATLLFGDGLTVAMRRYDALRFWRAVPEGMRGAEQP